MTNSVESQEKGEKIEAIARDTNDRLSELTWDWGKKIDLHARGEIFSSYCIAVKLDRDDDRIRVNFAWREHVNHIYSHLKVHSFRKSLDSSTCELSFYHDVSLFFWQKCLYTAELASASCNTQDRIQLEALISLYERDKTKNQVKTTAGAVSV